MNYKHFILLTIILFFTSCKKDYYQTKIEGARLEINDSLSSVSEIEDFIKPYREHVNSDLDSVLAYSVDTYSKTDGELNTAIGNLMADIILEQGSPVYESRTDRKIDMVLLNHGGIRSILSKGNISARTGYSMMPFENQIAVVELKGKLIKDELIPYLTNAKRAHPISGLKLKVDSEFNLIEASINGETINDDTNYSVATSDFLYFGGDRMDFFKKGDSLHLLNYKIRNALIDYFRKVDTINPTMDDRFIKAN